MRRSIAALLLGVLPLGAGAQQMDMEALAKWGAADLVRYHIVGDYRDARSVASDGSGMADVVDRVIVDLTWKLSESKLVGAPTFQNFKTTVSNLRDRERACLAPILKGELEVFDVLAIKEGLGGSLEMTVRTTYPTAEIAQFCTASRRTVPGKTATEPMEFGIVSPVAFAMPPPASGELVITPDKKSIVVKKHGWTWTMTPTMTK